MNKLVIQYDDKRYSADENRAIREAYEYAFKAHEGQIRKSGKPYITHPVAVAETVALWGMDYEAIVAALLHDVAEDTETTVAEIETIFGSTVAILVDGLTKLAKIEALPSPEATSARLELSNENLRKLLLASSRDFRVIIIKLADRLHNLRTLNYLKPEKQKRVARESLEIFAPIADRLGMGQVKSEIEDLSFRYWQPEEYERIKALVATTEVQSDKYLLRFKRAIRENLTRHEINPVSIEGRHKHIYSIYKKLVKTDGDIEKIYDLIALRIIVNSISDCYKTLGAIHQEYKPLIYRIKDYIAVPKPNGYQSLHTTVFGLDGHITEIQIRTVKMHDEAEHGVAAHFYYDAQKSTRAYARGDIVKDLPEHMKWVNDISILSNGENTQEFADVAKQELFGDRIFVFSPKGDLYELPEGSTTVDFAFAIRISG
jgi:guanosine-3',5'-bis(diphosphate) 3'-pyrophosphohydrolase